MLMDVREAVGTFPSGDTIFLAEKIALATGIGLLIGLERQWAHKEPGTRSFALASILGALAWLLSPTVALIEVGVVMVLIGLVNWVAWRRNQALEVTTSFALALTNLLGMLVGQGAFFAAITGALIVTALLAVKAPMEALANKLTFAEIRSALVLGFLALVLYPLLPDAPVDPWGLLNPHAIWLTVVIISALSFVNYVLLRMFGSRGLLYSAMLGGLVNSAATSALLADEVKQAPAATPVLRWLLLLADLAMIVRNGGLLAIFAWPGGVQPALGVLFVLGPMALVAGLIGLGGWLSKKRQHQMVGMPLTSPLSLRAVLSLGGLFVGLTLLTGGAQRLFGIVGFYVVVIAGALASAVSSAALAGTQTQHHVIPPLAAVLAIYGATVVGLIENVVIVGVVTRSRVLPLQLGVLVAPVIAVGTLAAVVAAVWHPF
jgi:uncharacterized membrane protein (DUF4010 family)